MGLMALGWSELAACQLSGWGFMGPRLGENGTGNDSGLP